jgi:mono/diheme cytochrome c family protein
MPARRRCARVLRRAVSPAWRCLAAGLVAIATFGAAGPATAQATGSPGSPPSSPSPPSATAPPAATELGRHEFESNCATCHGMAARGDGPMRPFLAREPADLTTLAQRNGGRFPKSAIADLIDGRGMTGPGPHGTREMPVWGRVYLEQSQSQTRGTPFPAEWSVRGRILALVEYLHTLQRP